MTFESRNPRKKLITKLVVERKMSHSFQAGLLYFTNISNTLGWVNLLMNKWEVEGVVSYRDLWSAI